MKRRPPSVLPLILVCLMSPLFANDTGQARSQENHKSSGVTQLQTTPLRINSRMVQVNVIVQDKNGQPVTGLKKDDFTIMDKGEPQSIAFMSEQTNRLLSTGTAVAAQPPANLYSNRFEEKYGVPTSVTVVLLDLLNTQFKDMAFARGQVVKFLRQIQPTDRVALYGLSDKLHILHDFTTDSTALLHALERSQVSEPSIRAASDPPPSDTGDAEADAFINEANARVAQTFMVNRVGMTSEALIAIANHLASLPGRKNLVWVSGSFPFRVGGDSVDHVNGPRTFNSEIEATAKALSNANLAIYPVDARGLLGPDIFAVLSGGSKQIPGSPPPGEFDTMVTLADRTGGRPFYNTNDINGAIRRAIDDSRVTYVLGYYPTHNEWNGRFREIKVEVGRPGMQVRSRKGYFAFPDGPASNKEAELALVEAAKSPLESTGLGLDVRVDREENSNTRQLKLAVRIEPSQVLLVKNGDRWKDDLDIKWVQVAADGHVLSSSSQTMNMNLPQQAYEVFLSNGVTITREITLLGDAAELRLAARDGGNGAIGSVDIPLTRVFGQIKTVIKPQ
jgi:VWFA-related protein